MEGWVRINRRLLEWEWHDRSEMVALLVHILLLANQEKRQWHGISIEPGQVATTIGELCTLTGLTTQRTRTAIKHLEECGMLTIKSTNKYSIITICNTGYYEADFFEANKQTTINQQTKNGPTNKQNNPETICITSSYDAEIGDANKQTTNKPTNKTDEPKETNKEKRTKKEIKKENPSSSPFNAGACDDLDGLFEDLKGTSWYEGLQREIYRHSGRMPTDQDIGEYIARYKDQLILTGDADHERRDIQRHFTNWLRCAIAADNRKQNSNERGRDNRTDYEQRSDAEFEAHIAAMLSGGGNVH